VLHPVAQPCQLTDPATGLPADYPPVRAGAMDRAVPVPVCAVCAVRLNKARAEAGLPLLVTVHPPPV
jgi:hypothetical protein